MRNIHEVLDDDKSASVLTQITMNPEGITASGIAKNTNIPQSTIYDHLRMLENEDLIYSKVIKVKNIVQKNWFRTDKPTFPDTLRIINKQFDIGLLGNKNDIASRLRFSQAMARKGMVGLSNIKEKNFINYQETSLRPLFFRQYLLNKGDYEFVFNKLVEIEKELEERNKSSIEDRGFLYEEETYSILFFCLPDFSKEL